MNPRDSNNEVVDMSVYRNKFLLIVNTATRDPRAAEVRPRWHIQQPLSGTSISKSHHRLPATGIQVAAADV
jgi:hypothetical protein